MAVATGEDAEAQEETVVEEVIEDVEAEVEELVEEEVEGNEMLHDGTRSARRCQQNED